MSDRARVISWTMILGGVLGILCCSPLLLPAIFGAGGLAAVLFFGTRVFALALLAAIALFVLLVYRDRKRPQAVDRTASSAGSSGPRTLDDRCPDQEHRERWR